jgi:hypothetical protein
MLRTLEDSTIIDDNKSVTTKLTQQGDTMQDLIQRIAAGDMDADLPDLAIAVRAHRTVLQQQKDAAAVPVITTTVTCCAWLVRRSEADMALEMRDEFCHQWDVDPRHWNGAVDELIEYVARSGETPETSVRQLLKLRY